MNSINTFNDSKIQSAFSEKGYVVLPKILDSNDITLLSQLLLNFEAEVAEPFHTSHFSTNIHYKKLAHNTIVEIVFPKIELYLNQYIPVFGNFMIKKANADNFLQMHADWTYVDESKNRTISVWIPLVDTNKKNGCLGVIEYSHKFVNTIRGPGIRQNKFDRDKIWVKKYGKLLPVKAGDAIIYDHALLHYSLPNTSSQIRPALNLSLVPKGVPIIHYCSTPEGAEKIEKYHVSNPDLFLQYENGKPPVVDLPIENFSKSAIQLIDEKMENYERNYGSFIGRVLNLIKTKKVKDMIHVSRF